jgi:hypothetical protein
VRLWDYLEKHPGGTEARLALLASLHTELSAPDVGFTAAYFEDPATRRHADAVQLAADAMQGGGAGGAGGDADGGGFPRGDAALDARMRAMMAGRAPRRRARHVRGHAPWNAAALPRPAPPPPPAVQVDLWRAPAKPHARKKAAAAAGAAGAVPAAGAAAGDKACGRCNAALPPASVVIRRLQAGGALKMIEDPVTGQPMRVEDTGRSASLPRDDVACMHVGTMRMRILTRIVVLCVCVFVFFAVCLSAPYHPSCFEQAFGTPDGFWAQMQRSGAGGGAGAIKFSGLAAEEQAELYRLFPRAQQPAAAGAAAGAGADAEDEDAGVDGAHAVEEAPVKVEEEEDGGAGGGAGGGVHACSPPRAQQCGGGAGGAGAGGASGACTSPICLD